MDLIERKKLIEILAEMQGRCATKAALVQNSKIWQQVKDMPTIEAEPVRHSKWIPKIVKICGIEHELGMKCERCGEEALSAEGDDFLTDYCPCCGARMDKREEE